ncbi:hypothetical protein ACFSSF_13930 [Dietzia aerolata]
MGRARAEESGSHRGEVPGAPPKTHDHDDDNVGITPGARSASVAELLV